MRRLTVLLVIAAGGCATVEDFGAPLDIPIIEAPLPVELVWFRAPRMDGIVREYLPARVFGNMLFSVDDRGEVSALDAVKGHEVWRRDLDLQFSTPPEFVDGQIAIGAQDGTVIALDARSGNEVWRSRVSSEVIVAPSSARGVVVVHSNDGRVFGLDAVNGRRLWVYEYSLPRLTLRGASTPLIDGDQVFVGQPDGVFTALGLFDGRTLWQTQIAEPQGRTELERLVDIVGTPVIRGSLVYVAAYQGRVAAVDRDTGHVRWSRDISSFRGPALADDVLYVVDDLGGVMALDAATGATLWRQNKLAGRALSTPLVDDSRLVVADTRGDLYWLERTTGRLVARRAVDSEGVMVTAAPEHGIVYAIGKHGIIEALRVDEPQ